MSDKTPTSQQATPQATPKAAITQRPLSPHLQVYRLPVAAILSITTRAAGIALTVGMFVAVWWLWALAKDPVHYIQFLEIATSPFGWFCLVGWVAAFFWYFVNGIRHLLWNSGFGLDIETVRRTNIWFIVLAVVLIVKYCLWIFCWL